MRLWKELPVGERIAITFVIVLAILFALALVGYLTGRWDEAEAQYKLQSAIPSQPTKYDTHMFALDREALHDAYRDAMKNYFLVMLKSDDKQAGERAIVGALRFRKNYVEVLEAIERREKDEHR